MRLINNYPLFKLYQFDQILKSKTTEAIQWVTLHSGLSDLFRDFILETIYLTLTLTLFPNPNPSQNPNSNRGKDPYLHIGLISLAKLGPTK